LHYWTGTEQVCKCAHAVRQIILLGVKWSILNQFSTSQMTHPPLLLLKSSMTKLSQPYLNKSDYPFYNFLLILKFFCQNNFFVCTSRVTQTPRAPQLKLGSSLVDKDEIASLGWYVTGLEVCGCSKPKQVIRSKMVYS